MAGLPMLCCGDFFIIRLYCVDAYWHIGSLGADMVLTDASNKIKPEQVWMNDFFSIA